MRSVKQIQPYRTRKYLSAFVLAAMLPLMALPVSADDWAAPQIKEVFSASREYFLRMTPGESLGDTVGFAGSKKGKYAAAEFYRRDQDRSYKLIAETVLFNPVAPVEFFVSDDGHLATIDNWHNIGYGKVVSLYDSRGKIVRSYELKDLFQEDEITAFRRSVSSIHWRSGPAYIRPDQKTLLITVKSGGDFLFGMQTGQFKYCEYKEKTYRCRSTNQPREWVPNNRVPLTR